MSNVTVMICKGEQSRNGLTQSINASRALDRQL